MRFDKLTAYNQYILEEEFCFRVSKYEKVLHNVKVYQAWNKLWSGYILAYICHFHFFLIQWCKLQLGVYIRDHRGKSKLFTKQTRHNHKFLGSCELKAPLYIYIDLQSWIIWSKTFIATQSFMLHAEQSSGNCQK